MVNQYFETFTVASQKRRLQTHDQFPNVKDEKEE